MQTPFADCEKAVREIAVWERNRIENAVDLAARGFRPDPDAIDLGVWRRRALTLGKAADILALLAPNEAAIRALVPALLAAEAPLPSMWQGPPASRSPSG